MKIWLRGRVWAARYKKPTVQRVILSLYRPWNSIRCRNTRICRTTEVNTAAHRQTGPSALGKSEEILKAGDLPQQGMEQRCGSFQGKGGYLQGQLLHELLFRRALRASSRSRARVQPVIAEILQQECVGGGYSLDVSLIIFSEIKIKALSQLMIYVGSLLAKQIDSYAHSQIETYPVDKLHNIIKKGNMHIGRMLYYLPFEKKGEAEDDWCGWHNDHGSLTALTSAMYVDENNEEIKFSPKEGGLYAKNRFD